MPRVHTSQGGFTVLELVIVLAVTAVIAALTVSIYQTHTARTQIAASMAAATPVEIRIVESFRAAGTPPTLTAAADLPAHLTAGPYVDAMEVINGRIDLRFGTAAHAAIAGKTLSMTPYETADLEVVWICGNRVPGVGLKPLGFAGGGPQATRIVTPIDDRYLPATCR